MNAELERRVLSLPVRAVEIRVTDQKSLSRATEFILSIKALQKEIDEAFNPIIKAAHEAHRRALEQKKKFEDPLIQAEKIVKPRIAAYIEEQEKKRREAELERLFAECEKKRIEEELLQKAQEAEARAKAAGDEEERRASQLEADRILAQAAEQEKKIAPAPVVPEAPRIQGLAMRENWDFEIVDETAIPREFMCPDEVKIRRAVKIMKEKTNIPGIRVFNRPVVQKIGTRGEQARPL